MRRPHVGLDHDQARITARGPRRVALGAAILAAGCAAAAAAMPLEQLKLPSIRTRAGPGPPFVTRALPPERIFPGRISSVERITVDLEPMGSPLTVQVRQRLTVHGKGDYSFVVRAPVVAVERAQGSESEPGRRRGLILWQGFSPGGRVLAVDAHLRVDRAAPYLPLRIVVRRAGRRVHISVRNVTALRVRTFSGHVAPAAAARVLDELRRAAVRGTVPPGRIVPVRSPALRMAPIDVAFAVTGALSSRGLVASAVRGGRITSGAGEEARFAGVLGGSGPSELTLTSLLRPGASPPRLRITAVPQPPTELLEPTRAPSWLAAVREGRAGTPREILGSTLVAIHALARWRRYQRFVENPDAVGHAEAVYVFRTVTTISSATTQAEEEPAKRRVLVPLLVLVASFAAVGGLAIVWAHS